MATRAKQTLVSKTLCNKIYIVYKHGVSIQDGRSYWRYTLHGMQRLHKSILLLLAESVQKNKKALL